MAELESRTVSEGVIVKEPPDGGCGDHEWSDELEREYDLPDPDPRNPIHVLPCLNCEAERHEGTYNRYFPGSRDLRSEAG